MTNAIQDYLEQNGMRPSELAKRMGVAPSTVVRHTRSRAEGGRGLSWSMAKKYAEQGIPWDQLVRDFPTVGR